MKTVILSLILLTVTSAARAQEPRPPVGVPSDARYFNGKFYKVCLEKLPWHAAKAKASSIGGRLAIVPDAATWGFVKQLAGKSTVWLGATDEALPGQWKWVDGTAVEFSAWHPGEPNNTNGIEHYLTIYKGAWNDVGNTAKENGNLVTGFVCEWRAATFSSAR